MISHLARVLFSVSIAALALSACGDGAEDDDAGNGTQQPTEELVDVTLRLNFIPGASAAPFYYAKHQGWYEDAGLNVSIEAGQGSLVTAQTVGSGEDEFGYVTADAAIGAITQGSEIEIVALLQRQSNMTVVHHPEYAVTSVNDLFELQLITAEFFPQPGVLRGLVASSGEDPEQLDIVNADVAAWPGLWERTPNGAVLGRIGNEDVRFEAIDDVDFITYTELGLDNFLGNTIVVNASFAAENPELTSGFVDATVRAFEASIEDPEAAVAALEEALPDIGDLDVATRELQGTLDATPGQGIETMEIVPIESEWIEDMIAFMEDYMGLEDPLPAEEYFTNEYLDR